jgi:hypothetical protein
MSWAYPASRQCSRERGGLHDRRQEELFDQPIGEFADPAYPGI